MNGLKYICFVYYRTKVDDIKELQKLRERPKGVSSVGLALGKKISQTEDVDSVSFLIFYRYI